MITLNNRRLKVLLITFFTCMSISSLYSMEEKQKGGWLSSLLGFGIKNTAALNKKPVDPVTAIVDKVPAYLEKINRQQTSYATLRKTINKGFLNESLPKRLATSLCENISEHNQEFINVSAEEIAYLMLQLENFII